MAGQTKTFNVILLLLFSPSLCFASSIVINEIAWMGNENSGYDEWIELKNNTENIISLDSWILKINSSQIYLKGQIPAHGFYLLERSDDDSVPAQKANLIYKGGLNNSGSVLELYENEELIDYIDCSKGWFKGNNDTKQTMERINLEEQSNQQTSWQTSAVSQGTPKKENSILVAAEESDHSQSSLVVLENSSENRYKYLSFVYALILSLLVLRVKKLINQKK